MFLRTCAALGLLAIAGQAAVTPPRAAAQAPDLAATDASFIAFERLTPIPPPAAPGSMAPQLAASAEGRLFLSWLEPAGAGRMRLRVAEHRGEAWEARADVAEGADLFANWADTPSIFAAKDGRLAAHWLQKVAAGTYAYGVRVRISADQGRTWSPVVVPHRDSSPTEHGFLSFFDAPDGNIGMVWLDGRATAPPAGGGGGHGHGAGAMTLRATTLLPDGTLGTDTLVDNRVCDCCPTSAAITAHGILVAYRDRSPGEIRDISVARFADGAWQPGKRVHADGWKIPGCPVNGPALASNGDVVALAWFTAAGNTGRVQAVMSRDGGRTFGAPVRIDDGKPLGRVDAEVLPDGSAVVAWIETAEGRAELRARRIAAGGRRGPSAAVSPVSADRSSGNPHVVRRGAELIFAWRAPSPSSHVTVAVAALPASAAEGGSR